MIDRLEASSVRKVDARRVLATRAGALLAGLLCLGLVFGAAVILGVRGGWAIVLAATACGALGAGFGHRWPQSGWRWGIWVSAAFLSFLLVVFASLAREGDPDPMPLLDALFIVGAACAGAALAGRRQRRSAGR